MAFSSGLHQGSKGGVAIVDYTLLSLGAIFNCLALHSVLNTHFSLRAYRCFLISLVVSDIFVVVINLINVCNQALADQLPIDDQYQPCVTNFLKGLLIFGVLANLYNLCGMSIDHYIGIVSYNFIQLLYKT